MIQDADRSYYGVIEVPVEAIDGEETDSAVIEVRGNGDGSVVLEIGDRSVKVRAHQLATALASLAMLAGPPPYR